MVLCVSRLFFGLLGLSSSQQRLWVFGFGVLSRISCCGLARGSEMFPQSLYRESFCVE